MCVDVRSLYIFWYSFIISELNHPTFPMCRWAYNLRFPRMRKPTLRRRHTRDMGTAGTPFNLLFVIPSGNVANFKAITSENPKNHVLVFSKRIRSIWDSRYTIFESRYASREKGSPYKLFLLIFHLPFPLWLSKQGAMVSSHWFLTIRIFWQPKGGPFFNKDVATISSWTRWFVGGATPKCACLRWISQV